MLRCCGAGAAGRVLRGGCSKTWWSSRSLQSASVSLSRKAFSSVVSLALYVSSRCLRLGEPVKISRSKPGMSRRGWYAVGFPGGGG